MGPGPFVELVEKRPLREPVRVAPELRARAVQLALECGRQDRSRGQMWDMVWRWS